MHEMNLHSAVLLTIGYHLPRSKSIFKTYHLPIMQYYRSEDIVKQIDRDIAKELLEQFESDPVRKNRMRLEQGIHAFMLLDRRGTIVRQVTKHIRHQNS